MINVRIMTKEDIHAAAELEKICFSVPWSETLLLDSLESGLYTFFCAEEEQEILGYLGLYLVLDEAEVANVCVSPDHRRKGIGEMLLDESIRYSKEKKAVKLTLEVRESNIPAISLYEKKGFERIGLRKNYYEFPREHAILYGLTINGEEE